MSLTKIERRSSISTYKSNHSPVNNIVTSFLCFLTALFFSLLWILPFFQASSTLISLFLSSLSQSTNAINFPTPTCVFILGNLIVVLLIGESKIFSSKSSDLFPNDVCFYDGNFGEISIDQKEEKRALESCDDDEWEMGLDNSEELSKRADDFIARVNMQREIEAMMLTYCCELTTMKKRYKRKLCMELINSFLNLVAPAFTFVTLGLFLPPYVVFKYFLSVVRALFSEDVAGKVVLITGASSGIGEHLAYEYAKRGAYLALVARRQNALEEVADIARYYGSPDVITIQADVSKLRDCRRIVDHTMNHFGRLDHLVNNAGITHMTLFEEITDITSFRQIMDTNYWGSVYTTRFAIPYLRNSRGKIVVLSSTASWLPAPRMSIYNASKAAIRSMFETLRVEVAPEIGITIVTPGFVESELTKGKALYSEGKMEVHQDVRDALVGAIPVETAEACAKAIVRSACRGDRYLTEPSWFNSMYYLKAFCPEVVEWCYRMFVYTRPGASAAEAPNKQMVDLTGAKNVLYPSSIHSAEVEGL